MEKLLLNAIAGILGFLGAAVFAVVAPLLGNALAAALVTPTTLHTTFHCALCVLATLAIVRPRQVPQSAAASRPCSYRARRRPVVIDLGDDDLLHFLLLNPPREVRHAA